jgi:hypothetical protein
MFLKRDRTNPVQQQFSMYESEWDWKMMNQMQYGHRAWKPTGAVSEPVLVKQDNLCINLANISLRDRRAHRSRAIIWIGYVGPVSL